AHVPTLRRVLKRLRTEFAALVRAESAIGRRRQRQRVWRHLRKARQLAKELSPRSELLERWAIELVRDAGGLRAVAQSAKRRARRTAASRAQRTATIRAASVAALATPDGLDRLVRALQLR